MLRIEELYADEKFELVVFFLKENSIILADSLEGFNFDELFFVPGITPELVEEVKQRYFYFEQTIQDSVAVERDAVKPIIENEVQLPQLDESGKENETAVDEEQAKHSSKDAPIAEVYKFVPRSTPFIRYCQDNNKTMMSQLTQDDFDTALSLKGLGALSAEKLKEIYLDFYAKPNVYNSLNVSAEEIAIEDVFENLPHGGLLIRYCRQEGIKSVKQLKYFNFDHRAVKGVGEKSMKKLHQAYLSFLEKISDTSIGVKNFSKIPAVNRRLSIKALHYLGVASEMIRKLNEQSCYYVGDICEKGISVRDYHQIKKVLETLECPAAEMFSKEVAALRETARICLKRRCLGDVLQKIADDIGVTRERVRQINVKTAHHLRPIADMVANCLLWPDRNYFTFSDLQLFFDNDQDAEFCRYVLQESEEVVYLKFADKFFRRAACPDDLDITLKKYTHEIIGDGLNFYDNLETIETELVEYGIEILDFEDIMNYLVKSGYHFYGDYVIKGKQSYAKVCQDAVKKYFPNGIKLDSNEDNADIKRLRRIISQYYRGLYLPDNNRALTARVAPLLILCGRGKYCDIESVVYNINLFKEVYQFIQDTNQYSLYYREIFFRFQGRFLAETNITNSHFLHGMLKYLYPDDFTYERDLLIKDGKPRQVIENRICDLIINKKRPVAKAEIKEHIPGLNDHVIAFAVMREPKLIQWEYNVFNHIDNIIMTQGDYMNLAGILKSESDNYNGYLSDSLLFTAAQQQIPEFLSKNKVQNAHNLFYIAAAYFDKQYKFRRPHIISPHFLVDELNILNIAKVLLNYEAGINYLEFISLASSFGWADATIHAVFSEIEKGCIRVSENDYVDENSFVLSEDVLSEFKKQINLLICSSGYFALNGIFDFDKFSDCNYEWNGFLIESIIMRFEMGFKIIAPQVKDRRYQKGIIVYSSYKPDSFDELVVDQFKKDGIKELSEQELEKYLKMKGLILKVIPQELYECAGLSYKNERFIVLN